MSVEVPGELDPRGAHGSRSAVDENPPSLPKIRRPQAVQSQDRPVADRRRLFEGHAGRHAGQRGTLPHADELRVCAEVAGIDPEDVVADLELADGCADRFDLTGKLAAERFPLRSEEAGEEAADEGVAAAHPGIRPVDRRGMDLDEDFVVLWNGPLDVSEPQNVRGPVPVVDDRSHRSFRDHPAAPLRGTAVTLARSPLSSPAMQRPQFAWSCPPSGS